VPVLSKVPRLSDLVRYHASETYGAGGKILGILYFATRWGQVIRLRLQSTTHEQQILASKGHEAGLVPRAGLNTVTNRKIPD